MKRFFRLSFVSLMFFVFAGLVACSRQPSSNSFSGSKYRRADDEKMVISFVNKTEWRFLYDGEDTGGGTYEIENKIITLNIKGEVRAGTLIFFNKWKFEIIDKNQLKQEKLGVITLWNKI